MATGNRPTRRRGYKPRDFGSAKEAATALILAAGGVDRAAAGVRVGKSQLQRYMDPDEPLAHMPLDIAETLTRLTRSPVVAEFFAELVGDMLMPRPKGKAGTTSEAEWLRDAAQIGRAITSYLAEFSDLLADGAITSEGAQRLVRAADGVIRAVAEARARLVEVIELR